MADHSDLGFTPTAPGNAHADLGFTPTPPADDPKSVGGFLSNTVSSAGRFVGDIAGAVTHPGRTLEGMTGLLEGMAEKSGFKPVAGVSHEQNVDALMKMYGDRYGSMENFKNSLYTDPVGVLADVATLASGFGAAGKGVELTAAAAKLPRVADVASAVARGAETVSGVTDPLKLTGKLANATGVTGLVSKGADALSTGLMKGALKGGYSTTTPAEEVATAAKTAKDLNIPVSDSGAAKIHEALKNLQQTVNDKVDRAATAGVTIDPVAVEQQLHELRTRYAAQVNNVQDLKDIDKVLANFRNDVYQTVPAQPARPASAILGPNGQPVVAATPRVPASQAPAPIPVDRAQAMKVGTYEANARSYGADAAVPPQLRATVAAEKALAEGLRQELERAIPELVDLNPKQAKLLNLQGVLETAVNKYNNKGGFSGNFAGNVGLRGVEMGAGVGVLTHDPVKGIAAAALKGVLSDPVVQSRLAIGINKAQQLNPGRYGAPSMATALSRVNEYAGKLQQ